jgi:hypothetical protein
MSSEEEEEEPPPPCGPLQAALHGSFEMAHRESSMRAVHAITLERTNAASADHAAEISMEFAAKEAAAKEAAAKRLIAAERRATREPEEKAACDAGYPAWHAYWRRRREEAKEATATKRAAMASARKEAMSQPSQSCVFIDLGYDGPLTRGGDEGMTPGSSILAYLVPAKEEARSKVT